MKVPYVSIQNAVSDWIADNDLGHEEINEQLLLKWAVDCVRWCSTQEQLKHRVAILQIKNSRAELPDDFVMLAQAACNVDYASICDCAEDPDCCDGKNPSNSKTRREDLVQWVQGTLEKDCELEINLKCPTCHTTGCNCETPYVEVDVDRIWEMAHPEIYYGHFTRIGRFGDGPGQNASSSYYTPKFKLMRYSTNDYHKVNHLITNCPNVGISNYWREFTIQMPYIEVDFGEGEVLLSYLGRQLDDDGEIMIPDHPDIFEAIVNHLDYKWYRIQYKKTLDPRYGNISQQAMALREDHIGKAKSALEIPTAHQFKNYLETSSLLKRISRWSMDYAGNPTKDVNREYGEFLDGLKEHR